MEGIGLAITFIATRLKFRKVLQQVHLVDRIYRIFIFYKHQNLQKAVDSKYFCAIEVDLLIGVHCQSESQVEQGIKM